MITGSLYGFSWRMETGKGRYWVVKGDSEPIYAESLSKLDARLMERSDIPRVLPLEVEEWDSEITLRYRLPLGRSLEQYAAGEQLGLKQVLELLHSVVLILEDSRLHMLDEGKYVLHPSWILVGRNTSDLFLAYLPLRSIATKRSVRQELYQLAVRLLDGAGIKHDTCPVLLDCLKSSLFELGEFRQLLVGLQAETGPFGHLDRVGPEAGLRGNAEPDWPFPTDYPEYRSQLPPPAPKGASSITKEGDPAEKVMNEGDTLRFHTPASLLKPGVRRNLLLLALILIWGIAAWLQTEAVFAAAGGGTLILGAIYFKWSRRPPEDSLWEEDWALPDNDIPVHKEAAVQCSHAQQQPHNRPYQMASPGSDDSSSRAAPPERSFDWTASRHKLFTETPAQTVYLMQPDETVLLTPETELLAPRVFLESVQDSGSVTVELGKDRFVFGRSPEDADWVMEAAGVSRKHGAIIREGEGWSLIDYGSRNGSRLNGMPLIPDRAYPLKDGDRITAAQVEFIFRIA